MGSEESVERAYQIRSTWDFDPDIGGLPPGDVVDAFEFAADHNGLPDETWELVDAETGEVIQTHEPR